jgi:hypothetical protein
MQIPSSKASNNSADCHIKLRQSNIKLAWWYIPVIPTFGRQNQKTLQLETASKKTQNKHKKPEKY